MHEALTSFYARDRYAANVREAHAKGFAGVNLVVVSLVNNNVSCRSVTPRRILKDDPNVCSDMDAIKQQYDALLAWEKDNGSWVEVVATPGEAAAAVRAGKLAVVVSLEASDVLGPSETIGGGRFAGGYFDPERPQDTERRIDQYLGYLPEVSTLQPTHQIDNPFAGSAMIVPTFVRSQRWRERGPSSCDGRATEQWKYWSYDTGNDHYPACFADAAEDPSKPGLWQGLRRVTVQVLDPYVVPKWYKDQHPSTGWVADQVARDPGGLGNVYRNGYGLSEHGKLLLRVMVKRGMPIDASHMSWEAVYETDSYLADRGDGRFPIYLSHSFPFEWDLVAREQNTPDFVIDIVNARGGLVGVRPGDDEIRLAADEEEGERALSTERFRSLLTTHDCMGTSVGTGLFLSSYVGRGVRPAFGSDLNGFINQPGGTAQLRPPLYADRPCAAAVRSVGSEVGQRGLAHVGLLPSLYLEMLAQSGADPTAETTVQALQDGTRSYIDMWYRAKGEPPAGTATARRVVATVEDWEGLLFADGGARDLALVRVETDTGETALPRLRAIEATLPYFDVRDAPESSLEPSRSSRRSAFLPQLPTTVGLLSGWVTFGAYPEAYHFQGTRCVHSGVLDKAESRERCAPLVEAKHTFKANHHDEWTLAGKWDRQYPGPLLGEAGEKRTPFVAALAALTPGDEPSVVDDFPTARGTRAWLLASPRFARCLDDERFVGAPAPGVRDGEIPAYLEDSRGHARKCMCSLLTSLDHPSAEACGDLRAAWVPE